jgi:hypothetical protein
MHSVKPALSFFVVAVRQDLKRAYTANQLVLFSYTPVFLAFEVEFVHSSSVAYLLPVSDAIITFC